MPRDARSLHDWATLDFRCTGSTMDGLGLIRSRYLDRVGPRDQKNMDPHSILIFWIYPEDIMIPLY